MSLNVFAYRREHAEGPRTLLSDAVAPPFNEIAGPEVSRQQFWGTPALERRGFRLLPLLRDGEVWAEGTAELDALEAEARRILTELDDICRETGTRSHPGVKDWTENILEAVRVARRVTNGIGGVYIG
jgi:hypothetical protein